MPATRTRGTVAIVNPKLRAVLYPLLAAVCGYLASYFSAGCSPAQVQRIDDGYAKAKAYQAQAECARAALPLGQDPGSLTLEDATARLKALGRCYDGAPAADAGAE